MNENLELVEVEEDVYEANVDDTTCDSEDSDVETTENSGLNPAQVAIGVAAIVGGIVIAKEGGKAMVKVAKKTKAAVFGIAKDFKSKLPGKKHHKLKTITEEPATEIVPIEETEE